MSKTTSRPNELYFITLTVVDWIDIFTRRVYYDLIIENLSYCQRQKGLELFEYVIMTNHIHMICRGKDKPLSDIIRDFKTYTSKELYKLISNNPNESRRKWMIKIFQAHGKSNKLNKNFQIWQNLNYPTLLYNNHIIDQKTEYIHMNPVKAGYVSKPEDYIFSSANKDSPLKVMEIIVY